VHAPNTTPSHALLAKGVNHVSTYSLSRKGGIQHGALHLEDALYLDEGMGLHAGWLQASVVWSTVVDVPGPLARAKL